MSHWTKIKTQATIRQRRHTPADESPTAETLQARMEALERLSQAAVQHLTAEPADVLRWLADTYRGALIGDAAAQALERKGVLPDEFCNTPTRRIRRDL